MFTFNELNLATLKNDIVPNCISYFFIKGATWHIFLKPLEMLRIIEDFYRLNHNTKQDGYIS